MNARELALKTLVQINSEQAFSNLEINKIIKEGKIDRKDQNLFVTLVYGTLQHLLSINHVLKKFIKKGFNDLQAKTKWILRIAVYQILFLNNIPDYAIVNEAVEETKKINSKKKGLVNAVLRNIIRNKEKILKELKYTDNPIVRYSLPNWIYKLYKESYGKDTDAILNHINDVPDLYIRVKPGYFETVFKELKEIGAETVIDPDLNEHGLIIKKPSALKGGITQSPLFKKGFITVQDKGAILVGLALEPKEEELILDLCAAPGGKTTLLAEMMNNTGTVDAFDIHPHRVELIDKTANRLVLKNIKTAVEDATKFNPDLEEKYDRILVDAPCSGLGIIRRKPEIRYNITQKDIKELTKIQQDILNNAVKYLKPGGKLVYSTCTINRAENSDIVNKIKNQNENLELIDEVQTSFLDNSDGFYFAVMEKKN